jgi:hypothetical protein
MSDRESTIRNVLVTYFPMFIAVLSLVTSIFNGYLNARFVELIELNLGRTAYMSTCKDIIDAYFQVKFRAGLVNASAERERAGGTAPPTAEQVDAANAVTRFAALGTFLANLSDDAAREQYTQLSLQLEKIVNEARRTPPAEFQKVFEPADRMFTGMNEECVKLARRAGM